MWNADFLDPKSLAQTGLGGVIASREHVAPGRAEI